jgi:hypothetical protein
VDPLVRDRRPMPYGQTENLVVEPQRLVHVAHDDSHMIDSSEYDESYRCPR